MAVLFSFLLRQGFLVLFPDLPRRGRDTGCPAPSAQMPAYGFPRVVQKLDRIQNCFYVMSFSPVPPEISAERHADLKLPAHAKEKRWSRELSFRRIQAAFR